MCLMSVRRSSSVTGQWLALAMVSGIMLTGAGCTQIPHKHLVKGPTEITPPPPKESKSAAANGSIYRSNYVKPLFEDRRPRAIGDVLTVILNEDLNATKSSAANASRDGSVSFSPDQIPDVLGDILKGQSADISGKSDFKGSGGANASNKFTGRITTTVRVVLPNGNLRIAGEKQIGINQGAEYIRFSGTVNPRMISAQSTITSNKVADVRLSYYGDGYIDEAEHMGWFQRLLLNVSPF